MRVASAATTMAHRPSKLGPSWGSRLLALAPVAFLLTAFFVIPVLELTWRSFVEPGGGLSLGQYSRVFSDGYYFGVILQTFLLSGIVTAICILAGYPVAYFLVRSGSRWNGAIIMILLMPLLTSLIMRTYGWQVILARRGIVNSLLMSSGIIDSPFQLTQTYGAVVLGMVHLYVPFMVISIATVLQTIDRGLEEAGISLGATRAQTFFRITLPLSSEGIFLGSVLVFMMANGAFVTALLLGGNSVMTISLLIYQQFTLTRDLGFGAVLSIILVLSAMACLCFQMWVVGKSSSRRVL